MPQKWIVRHENGGVVYYDPDYYRQHTARGERTSAPAPSARAMHSGSCRDTLQRMLDQLRQRMRQDDDVLIVLDDDDDDALVVLED